ncbi:PPE family protein [Mycobacterium celatum]|uniref:PPE family protein n=1 Tax=Mycobacterium celatum TaxID=28045 RepID=A0A1X1RUG1_MYCCE|nr:PPE family protein [Mycobacterium celatum]ORV17886.1 hypothetical protein AWB95_06070 [Mycobacterium celatum]PIB74158.1 PPE family protein [Mycobacterium celatum]
MLEFAALPPEVNSARMYAGPGAGPMLTAASAWDALAAQLDLFVAGYSSVISGLHGESWSGEASDAMASAAAPFVAWASTTAAQAEQAASQARAAAAAYETAFAATVPPAAVAANRIQLATLVATNFFGQNTPAIAAIEAAYAEMWAQDAAAMYCYAASASAASTLTPFTQPPQTTSPTGQSAQASAVAQAVGSSPSAHSQTTLWQAMLALPRQLQMLASGASTNTSAAGASSTPILTAVSEFNTLAGPINPLWQVTYAVFSTGQFGTGLRLSQLQAAKNAAKPATPAVTVATTTQTTGSIRSEVSASVDSAERVGKLSVPQSWTAAVPTASPASEHPHSAAAGFRALPAWAGNPPVNTPGGPPPPAVGPMTNVTGRRTGNKVFRMRDRRFKMPRPPVGG